MNKWFSNYGQGTTGHLQRQKYGVCKRCKVALKIYTIQFAIKPWIRISSYLYTSIKILFKQQPLTKCWVSVASKFSLLSQKGVKILLPFATTYLCKTAFSALTNMMTKYRSKLVQSELRVFFSKISPRIDNLCRARQTHPLIKCHYS